MDFSLGEVVNPSTYWELFDFFSNSKDSAFDIANKLFDLPLQQPYHYFPYYERSCGPSWIQQDPQLILEDEFEEISLSWRSTLVAKDLLNGVSQHPGTRRFLLSHTILSFLLNDLA